MTKDRMKCVRLHVGDYIWSLVWDSVESSVRKSVWWFVRDSVWNSVWERQGGKVQDAAKRKVRP